MSPVEILRGVCLLRVGVREVDVLVGGGVGLVDKQCGPICAGSHVERREEAGLRVADGHVLDAVRRVGQGIRGQDEGRRGALRAGHLDRSRRPRGLRVLQVRAELIEARRGAVARGDRPRAFVIDGLDELARHVVDVGLVVVADVDVAVGGDEEAAALKLLRRSISPEGGDRAGVDINDLRCETILGGQQERGVLPAAHHPGLVGRLRSEVAPLSRRDALPLLLPGTGLLLPAGAGLHAGTGHQDVIGGGHGNIARPRGLSDRPGLLVDHNVVVGERISGGSDRLSVAPLCHRRVGALLQPQLLGLRARDVVGGGDSMALTVAPGGHVQGRALHEQRRSVVVVDVSGKLVQGPGHVHAVGPRTRQSARQGSRPRVALPARTWSNPGRLGREKHDAGNHRDDRQQGDQRNVPPAQLLAVRRGGRCGNSPGRGGGERVRRGKRRFRVRDRLRYRSGRRVGVCRGWPLGIVEAHTTFLPHAPGEPPPIPCPGLVPRM